MTDTNTEKQSGLIAYFANNSVAANLMMVFIIIMGIISYFTIQRQMFPNVEINYIEVQANYPGASPQEIEESILIKIEESLKDVTEIKRGVYRSFRNSGRASLEINTDAELTDVLDKVKLRVDSIATFPAGMEPVTISQVEFRQDVIGMTLVGDIPLTELKPVANKIEDELLQLSNVSLVQNDVPLDEIAIEIDPDSLRQYNLTLSEVASAVRRYSANISAGQLRTDAGIISVRVENQYYSGDEFRQIPVKIGANGAKVLLNDIAVIKDQFTEGERYFKFNGENAVYLSVKATKEQNMIPVADSVKAFIEQKNKELPAGLRLEPLMDMTYYLNARLDMMKSNLFQGAILVAIMLSIFLRFKLALWVMIGLPVCFLGAMMMMPLFGISINIVSLFAFIMVLGIVVDDAIVIGESAYTEIEKKGGGVVNVVNGAKRVATPATFGVLTTIAVFAPFTLSSGPESAFFFGIAVVVILCLIFSLIESKLILPAHIAHTKFPPINQNSWRARFNKRFFNFVNGPYKRFIELCVEWRWFVLFAFIGLLILTFGLISSNQVRVVPTPKVPHDFPQIRLEMNENASDMQTINAIREIEAMVNKVDQETEREFGQKLIRDILVFNQGRTEAQLLAPLVDEELRPYNAFELSRRWREQMPSIPGVKSLQIYDDVNGGGMDGEFGYLLYGPDIDTLNEAGRRFIQLLQQQKGLFDISSTIDPASKEVQLSLKPVAYDLGLDLANIANQVGASFYGGEAQRVIRRGEEVRVMVRYPKLTREAFASLKHAVITTPAGQEVMLGDVVELNEKPGISYIRREGGYRTVYIYGSIDEEAIEPGEVVKQVDENLLPQLKEEYPSVKTELGGSIEEQQAQANEQIMFFIGGMILVYILLAVPLKSYSQPLIVMSVIPFSLTGAIWGHFWFGLDISLMSGFGLIAAAGVVINDSLVMTDFVNQARREGISTRDAVIEAGCARFRAITLTSITTFAGVLPIMFETSLQAKFVIPMAVALGFAVMFATLITLVLVPCLYIVMSDVGNGFLNVFRAGHRVATRRKLARD
ncbi:MMPL family transporter [Pseudoalteromonas shioyasakiensis]|jgi:multidrug efflux pump subunit AcrB|uniref:Efflux RND transporter permease subunit n=1 Tax=Pseudoalteromonas shioyasakiensis TaxID=1190813 RepID=A0ABT6U1R9_9GAMM|nr:MULTISPECIES: efflux RND transporter permease subunit [Pseudoalteromonas]MCO6356805.1 MMPL family transporter [Pseudoalteromonas shioyasakiensis]MDI4653913.1 efflux RND transporter permease subunit [Pseudoalteromonas shioyasakiensis]MDI4670127.1 efflux RND transporter permease subunit [Pseudoalteromonas shioyasakiensis]MDI4675043.1 efflux RND transporter permease subunit [Pseudoalteromonas shioyasakiensis]MDI4686924.1 efflux RND transporter permease subunit [Pseudoalteromonas shioyasakiensi